MTGRARGRSRGRGRGGGGDAARRPGEGPQDAGHEQVAPVGRGRSRGPAPAQAAAPAPQQQPKPAAPPTQAMAAMSVREEQRPPQAGSAEQRPARRREFPSEPATKPSHIVDKKGATGGKVTLVTNHFKLMTRPNFGVFQYNVSYDPEQESKRVRVALLKSQSQLIGQVHAFDGMMLYLPKRLPETITKVVVNKLNGDPVEMTIMLTNEIPKDSPSMLQLYNIIFRRFVVIVFITCFVP